MNKKDVEGNIIQIKEALSTDTHLYGRLPDVEDRLDKIESKLNLTGTAGEYRGPKHEAIPPMQMDYSDTPIHGTADPHKCFVCGKPADMGWGNALGPQRGYCREHVPETATRAVGEYKCKYCNQTVSGKHVCIHPDLPLHARVAKALGKEVAHNKQVGWRMAEFGVLRRNEGKDYTGNPIPDYPNDLVAAMGALEEYSEKNCSIYIIRRNRAKDYQIVLYPPMTSDTAGWYDGIALPQAICEAIVAHAEGE